MPYIKTEDRTITHLELEFAESVDGLIEDLQIILRNANSDKRDGLANYMVSRIIAGGLKPVDGWNYN